MKLFLIFLSIYNKKRDRMEVKVGKWLSPSADKVASPLLSFLKRQDRESVSPAGELASQTSSHQTKDKSVLWNRILNVTGISKMEIEFKNLEKSVKNLNCNYDYVPSAIENIESKFYFTKIPVWTRSFS